MVGTPEDRNQAGKGEEEKEPWCELLVVEHGWVFPSP
jgi:hypothetical protein